MQSVIMLSIVIQNVVMLSDVKLSMVMRSVVMLFHNAMCRYAEMSLC